MAASDLPQPDYAQAMRVVGYSDQGGRPDAMQMMVYGGHAYVGHLFSGGFSVLDVGDPGDVRPVHFEPAPPNTWNIHLQTADDLLLVVHAKDLWAEFRDESAYYGGSVGTKLAGTRRDWSAGMAVYDISRPAEPRRIGFLPVDGVGVHRIWYSGGRWAYVSALPEGYTDYILLTVDLADPTHPVEAGRFWLPGMHSAGDEEPSWDTQRWRYALHHAIVAGDTAYASWRDGGLTLIDVSDRTRPELVVHRNWSPPFGGGTHTALPLPERRLLLVADEATADDLGDGLKHTWIFDVREPANPISVATLPTPDDAPYAHKGAHFGPHNLHENRPGSFISDTLVFGTYQNAGVRAFDISHPYRPRQVGALVPPPPTRMVDTRKARPRVVQTADVFATTDGILYLTDYNAGLTIAEYTG
jgi:hypothetical protein